jgi:hypothetical protein
VPLLKKSLASRTLEIPEEKERLYRVLLPSFDQSSGLIRERPFAFAQGLPKEDHVVVHRVIDKVSQRNINLIQNDTQPIIILKRKWLLLTSIHITLHPTKHRLICVRMTTRMHADWY